MIGWARGGPASVLKHPKQQGVAWAGRSIGRSDLVGVLLALPAFLFLAAVSCSGAAGGGSAAAPAGGQTASSGQGSSGPATDGTKRDVQLEVGEMDPRLAEALNAFGAGRYDECRKLAEALIGFGAEASEATNARPTADTRAQCVGLIILSHLDQGDFAAAREAAERLRTISPDVCQDLLAQVNREERDYQAEVKGLQQIVTTTTDPEEAARADMRVARVHCVYGRLELAQRCYWNVIQGSPARPEAGCAVSHLALLAMERREYARGLSQMEQVARRYPKTPAALRAQMAIPMIHLAEGKPDRAITAYSAVAKRYPGTEAAVEAQFTMAEIHQAHGDIKRAVAAGWKPAALEALLEAYRKGVHVDPDRDRKSKYSLHVADLYSSLQRWAEARAAANEVLKLDPPDKRQFILRRRRARDVIADTYYRQGLYQEALALYEELLAECISQPQEALLGSTAEPVEREGYQRWIEEIRQVQSQALPGETPAEQAARLQEEER